MPLKFTIVDRTTNAQGDNTVIDEPVGWDSIGMRLKRKKEWHGFFDFFDDVEQSLQFDSEGFSILKAAFDRFGVEANVDLMIEFACIDTDAYEQVYYGNFVFARYKEVCGDRCYIEIGLEADNCIMRVKNRMDQKVDLDSLESMEPCKPGEVELTGGFNAGTNNIVVLFDSLTCLRAGQIITIGGTANNDGRYTIVSVFTGGGTSINVAESLVSEGPVGFTLGGLLNTPALTPYTALNTEIILPPKAIRYRNDWSLTNYNLNYVDDVLDDGPLSLQGQYYFIPEWDTDALTEIRDSDRLAYQFGYFEDAAQNFIATYSGFLKLDIESAIVCPINVEINVDLEGTISLQTNDTINFDVVYSLVVYDPIADPDNFLQVVPLKATDNCTGCGGGAVASFDFDISETVNLILSEGQSVAIYIALSGVQYTSGSGDEPTDPFELNLSITTGRLQVMLDTNCVPTPAKVYMVNEALSRVVESYSGDCLRVYSDYFGRTDAQPYTSEADGCGALECITTGLKIRSKAADGRIPIGDAMVVPKMEISLKDAYEGLSTIHNIGMGVEDDPNRLGSYLVRVEPMPYFYKSDVLMTCDHVKEVEFEMDQGNVFSSIKMGYQKWETENANGLNDVFSQREYRTSINSLTNIYERLCRFVASDYAIEVTRRQYGGTTKDWRYDNDTFIICLTRSACNQNTEGIAATFNAPDTISIIEFATNPWFQALEVGDTFTVSNTSNNNNTFTITASDGNGTFTVSGAAVVDEITPDATFCLTYQNYFAVEQGNVTAASNILFPESCYNLRITPARNAMRHIKTIFQTYRQYLDGALLFTHGTGNYLADIDLVDDACLNESGSVAENDNLTYADFATPADNYPLFRPELVKFEYPVSWEQYKAIRANPYGLIEFQCGDGAMQQGWIEDFQYKPYEGIGQFTLKPKISE